VAKILCIEDDESTRTLLAGVLRKAGHEVEDVGTAEEGLAVVGRGGIELLLLDLKLPGMSGLEACQRLKKDPATVRLPILMLTALGHHSSKVRGLDMGADDYVVKPVRPGELVARVEALLRRYNAVR
jgi:two-component system phosphate regulon response regulator PhoB